MSRLAEKIVSPFFGKKKYYRIWNKLYKASMMGMNVGNGGDFESSGEKYAMGYVKNLLKNIDKPVLFDVGANRGDYAKELVKNYSCLLYTSTSPRDGLLSRMTSSA